MYVHILIKIILDMSWLYFIIDKSYPMHLGIYKYIHSKTPAKVHYTQSIPNNK